MKLGHINLYVRDAEKSHAFYVRILGLHTYHVAPGRAVFMSADKAMSHEVALMTVGPDAPLQQKGQVGLNHMAWMVDSLDELKVLYQRTQGQQRAVGSHLRPRAFARHLLPRSGRQRAGGIL